MSTGQIETVAECDLNVEGANLKRRERAVRTLTSSDNVATVEDERST